MKSYVVGFLFNQDYSKVALIEKQHPDWQKGFLNGIGGKIEPKETPFQAIVREFREEAGVETLGLWSLGGKLYGPDAGAAGEEYVCHVFYGIGDLTEPKTMTDEEVHIVNVSQIKNMKVIHNLNWLIQLVLDESVSDFEVKAA